MTKYVNFCLNIYISGKKSGKSGENQQSSIPDSNKNPFQAHRTFDGAPVPLYLERLPALGVCPLQAVWP